MKIRELESKLAALLERSERQEQALVELSEHLGQATYRDGPHAPAAFLWQGRVAPLSKDQFRLAYELWQSPERRRNSRELAIVMFDDEERAGKTLANISRKSTKALERRGIPVICEPVGNEIWMHYPAPK